MQELKQAIQAACKKLFDAELEPEISRPSEQFGDYATNVALQLAKKAAATPRQIAQQLVDELQDLPRIERIGIAGPGFINFSLTDEALQTAAFSANDLAKPYTGQEIIAEYSDPNPFKVLHVGHLYTSVVGDAIANLLETAGANVHRVNFGGDVGLHVAKTMWAILKKLDGAHPEKLADIPAAERSGWLAEAYIEGNRAYEESAASTQDIQIKQDILLLNQIIYGFSNKDSAHEGKTYSSSNPQSIKLDADKIKEVYNITRQWSYDYFKHFYKRIGTQFEKYYPESETVEPGLKAVKDNLGKVFEESDGAVVFKGEVENLHTRVFINRQGLPTYETKDVGLILKKWEDYHFDKSIVITGNEIYDYMQVVLKAVEQFAPELVQKTTHLTHGLVKLAGGTKMSSRKGNIIGADEVLEAADEANKAVNNQNNFEVALGAVKYAFLKNRIGADLIFDPNESVSLEGNSGPYLQYAHARARSILTKAEGTQAPAQAADKFEAGDRSLARKISEYPEVVEKAAAELMPHHICTYLYELAQVFNQFYEMNRVIGDEQQFIRLKLVEAYANVLKSGLGILNITAPERM